jgi:hypothetical protein
MDAQKYPRANWPYLLSIALLGTLGITFIIWSFSAQVAWSHGQPISGGWTWPTIVAFTVALVVALLALYWKIYRDAYTSIGSHGVSQPGLRGLRTFAWSEITRVKSLGGLGFHIHSGRKQIIITAYAYKNAPEVIETLRNKFKDHDTQLS